MIKQDTLTNGEPKSRASPYGLGAEEGVKDPIHQFWRNSGTAIRKANQEFSPERLDMKLNQPGHSGSKLLQDVASVGQEVYKHLA